MTDQGYSLLENVSIHAWIRKHKIKTERGQPLDFYDHPFLFDPYSDMSPLQVMPKPAQVGATLKELVRIFYVADKKGLDIIYTLPTDSDVNTFVGARVNAFIRHNPVLQKLTADRDNIETKRIGDSTVYFRGTWTKRAAISVPTDLLIHDEIDASKQSIVEEYETRLQHSKFKWRWVFSHPSTEGVGVDKFWRLSDQKHWFVTCPHCKEKQYLGWPENVCPRRGIFVCVECDKEIGTETRRRGEWVQKYKDKDWSGYQVNALMCPWITAKEIIRLNETKGAEYFANKVLGVPYVGEGNKLVREDVMKNVTPGRPPTAGTQVVIGVDTGIRLHYVVGNGYGIFDYGEAGGYEEMEDLAKRYPRAIFVFDQGGDLIGPRKFAEKLRGRVYLCHYERDRKTMQLIRWGKKDEEGNVKVDRNRMISLSVGEFIDGRIPLYGTEDKWEEFWQHAACIYRVKEENEALGTFEYKWERSGPDHLFHAFLYCRVGLSRFKERGGAIISRRKKVDGFETGIEMLPGNRAFPPKA